MKTYIFFRKEGWHPVEYPDDEAAKRGAEMNPGTLRVETVAGRVVWRLQ